MDIVGPKKKSRAVERDKEQTEDQFPRKCYQFGSIEHVTASFSKMGMN